MAAIKPEVTASQLLKPVDSNNKINALGLSNLTNRRQYILALEMYNANNKLTYLLLRYNNHVLLHKVSA